MALTDKGKEILEYIFQIYNENEYFTNAELSNTIGKKIAPAIFTGLVNEGYLTKKEERPIKYCLINNAKNIYNDRSPKAFVAYSEAELKKEREMSYIELSKYLTNKYGVVDGSYFCNENCRSINHRIKRSKEDLYIHHLKEDKYIMLSNPYYARLAPWDCQLGENLVYCNLFEHLLLHMRIVLEWRPNANDQALPGIGGLIKFIIPTIFDCYQNSNCDRDCAVIEGIHIIDCYNLINQFFGDYEDDAEMYKYYPTAFQDLFNEIYGCEIIDRNPDDYDGANNLKFVNIK